MKYSHLADGIIQTNLNKCKPSDAVALFISALLFTVSNMSVRTNYKAVCSSTLQRNVINMANTSIYVPTLTTWSILLQQAVIPRPAWLQGYYFKDVWDGDFHDEDRPSQQDTAAGNSKPLQAI